MKILSWSWDAAIARLTVWWQLGDTRASEFMDFDDAIARLTVWWQLGDTRASEFMDFDSAGRVLRSEAFYGK